VRRTSLVGADGLNESFGEDEWDAPKHRCPDLVYKLTVHNTLEEPILVKVNISERSDAQKPINIRWPRTGIVGHLNGGEV